MIQDLQSLVITEVMNEASVIWRSQLFYKQTKWIVVSHFRNYSKREGKPNDILLKWRNIQNRFITVLTESPRWILINGRLESRRPRTPSPRPVSQSNM